MTARGGHLGDRAAALVDGELGTEARELALAHLARCDACRAEVAAQRRLKARLVDLVDPTLPGGLLERLATMAQASGTDAMAAAEAPAGDRRVPLAARLLSRRGAPRRGRDFGRSGPARSRRAPAGRPRGGRRHVARLAMAGGSLVALGVTAFVAGGGSSAPTVVPNVRQLTVEHASTTGEVPFELPMPSAPTVFRQVSGP